MMARAGEETLGVARDKLIGIDLLKLHPEKSRDKLALLLASDGQADISRCPVPHSPPPMPRHERDCRDRLDRACPSGE
jgi:hypothetical protein